MTDLANILVTKRGEIVREQLKAGRENVPTLKQLFADNADMRIVGEDSIYCARFAVPVEKVEQVVEDIRGKGYIVESDYALKSF